jgi:hypothetical protein
VALTFLHTRAESDRKPLHGEQGRRRMGHAGVLSQQGVGSRSGGAMGVSMRKSRAWTKTQKRPTKDRVPASQHMDGPGLIGDCDSVTL